MKTDLLGSVDFRYLLVENYKKINLDERELAVVFMIDHLLKQKNNILTADLLAIKMTMPSKEIDIILSKLVTMKLINLEIGKTGAKLSLQPLKNKLANILKMQLIKETSEEDEEFIGSIYQLFEKELCRTLSPLEMARIQEWFTMSYTEDMIKNAIKDVKKERKLTLRNVDELLLQKSKSLDIQEEGYSLRSDKWNKNIQETIALTKTQWLKKDDE